MRVRCLVLSFIATVVSPAAGAAPRDGSGDRSIALEQARAIAIQNGPDVLLAQRRETIARAQIDVAGALPNPLFGVQTTTRTARLTTGMELPLLLFGQRGTAMAAATADADVAALDIAAVRVDARWNATSAWLDLWSAQERARLFARSADDAARVADIAKARFAAGSAPRLDEVRTRGESARVRAESDAASIAVVAASARLAVWLGGTDTGPWRATGTATLDPPPSQGEALARLSAHHPTLKRDRAQIEAARQHVRAEQRQRWPSVTAQLSLAQFDPTLEGKNVMAGLAFEPPLLNLRGGAIAHARAEQALAETAAATDLRRLAAQLDNAYRVTEGAALRADALTKQVLPALEEARTMTENGYRDGHVDLLRVLDAQRAVLDARLAELDAQSAWQHALAESGARPGRRGGRPMKPTRTMTLTVALLLVCAPACKPKGKEEAETSKRHVHCAPAQTMEVGDEVAVRGTIAPLPEKDAQVAAQVSGRILSVLVREGDQVAAGQVLAKVDSGPLADDAHAAAAALAKAHAEVKNAEATAARVQRVFEHGIAARQELDDATTRAEAARAAENEAAAASERAHRQLRRAEVASPLAGVVIRLFRRPGELVDGSPATPILEIADPSHLELTADAAASDLVRLRKGQRAEVSVAALPGRAWKGTVNVVSPAVDRATGLGVVRVTLELTDGDRPPIGLLGLANVQLGAPRSVVGVPTAAVRNGRESEAEVVLCGADGLAHVLRIPRGASAPVKGRLEAKGVTAGQLVALDSLGINDGDALELEK